MPGHLLYEGGLFHCVFPAEESIFKAMKCFLLY